ncbi:MAG: hypothetical protein K2X01_09760 [Cyanobacteria bacterium]|nr:hypothetical protein [Cyanobacteriota bacterium]
MPSPISSFSPAYTPKFSARSKAATPPQATAQEPEASSQQPEISTNNKKGTFRIRLGNGFRALREFFRLNTQGFLSDVIWGGIFAGIAGVAGLAFPPLWAFLPGVPLAVGTSMIFRGVLWFSKGFSVKTPTKFNQNA